MSLPHQVTSYPPLEQTTVIDETAGACITILLRWDERPAQSEWQVAVWHNASNDRTWTELQLRSEAATVNLVKPPKGCSNYRPCSELFRRYNYLTNLEKALPMTGIFTSLII